MREIDVIICNWCTARRTLGAIRNIRKYYPDIHIIIVDDASEKSKDRFTPFYKASYGEKVFDLDNSKLKGIPNTTYSENKWHKGHGLSLNNGVTISSKKFVLFFDSDIRFTKGGMIEDMLEEMKDEKVCATGRTTGHEGIFVHPMVSLWRKNLIEKYHLNFDEGEFFSLERLEWEPVTTCQWASYQLRRRGYEYKNVSGEYIHLNIYNKKLWDKYY